MASMGVLVLLVRKGELHLVASCSSFLPFAISPLADVHGSLEAVSDAIRLLPTKDVESKLVFCGVGSVSDSDLQNAVTCGGKFWV